MKGFLTKWDIFVFEDFHLKVEVVNFNNPPIDNFCFIAHVDTKDNQI